MAKKLKSLDKIFGNLLERAKELNCIYEVEELLQNPDLSLNDVFINVAEKIPPAMQFPEICRVKIFYKNELLAGNDFEDSTWYIEQDIKKTHITGGEGARDAG